MRKKTLRGYKYYTSSGRRPDALRTAEEQRRRGYNAKVKTVKGHHGKSYQVLRKRKR